MRILEDRSDDDEAHEFVVELEIDDARDGALRELWESAPDKGDYGGPHAMVRCEGGKVAPSALRALLRRFNEPPDDGWRWSAEALAAYLLHDLCGVVLLGWPYPPNRELCPHGNAYATDGGAARGGLAGNASGAWPVAAGPRACGTRATGGLRRVERDGRQFRIQTGARAWPGGHFRGLRGLAM